MTDLDPQTALRELDALASRHMARGQKLIHEAVAQGEDVVRVCELCHAAGIAANQWLADNWGMSSKSAQNYKRLFANRDRLPQQITPSVAVKLTAPHISDAVRDTVLGLIADGVQVSVALVDKLVRDDVFTESLSMVADYLLERSAMPNVKARDIVNELEALRDEISERRASGLAFDATFTDAVQQRAIEAREERDHVVHVTARYEGGVLRLLDAAALVDGRAYFLTIKAA